MRAPPDAIVIEARAESWPLAKPFVISRGTKTEARVVVVTARRGRHRGLGEAVPYLRYGESEASVLAAIAGVGPIESRADLARALPAGAARNAIDCALWALESAERGVPVAALAGVSAPAAVATCFTLSLDTPDAMAAAARAVPRLGLLKLKLGGADDIARFEAVRAARPDAVLVADANEAWTDEMVEPYLAAAAAARVALVEQPLPAGADALLAEIPHSVPLCADESAHTSADLDRLVGRYEAVNIKLDKAGGLTEALAMARKARALGFDIMVGSMVATSLAMAPALLLQCFARWIDLDSPLLLARDRELGLEIRDGTITPPPRALWA